MKKATRIEQLFANQKAFIAYITAGDGGRERSLESALALIEGGVNMLEIGVPFSDPIADGPVIQRAAKRALNAHTTLNDVLWLTQQIRRHSDIPLIFFSYLNPILAKSKTTFFEEAREAGVDGLLLVDCPLEESAPFHEQCTKNDISLIQVLSPSTSPARIEKINQKAQGFLYYACRKGTTGLRDELPSDLSDNINTIKSLTKLPVVVGFGISNRAMCESVLRVADGVVVGSFFVKAIEEGIEPHALKKLAEALCERTIL